jgi:hypothetical protein
MTAQIKAEELIDKFRECGLSDRQAVQCSIFVADELLNESKMKFCGGGTEDKHYKFWEDVKAILTIAISSL